MSKVRLVCESFRPIAKGSFCGFATIKIPEWRLRLIDISVHQHSSGARWASLPAKPQIDRDRRQVVKDGKPQYSMVIELIGGREVRDAFSAAVIDAVLRVAPDAFNAQQQEHA